MKRATKCQKTVVLDFFRDISIKAREERDDKSGV